MRSGLYSGYNKAPSRDCKGEKASVATVRNPRLVVFSAGHPDRMMVNEINNLLCNEAGSVGGTYRTSTPC